MKKLFTILAAVCFAGSMMAATATMQYKGTTTTNMADGANNAATVGLDADLFNVVSDKGSTNNHIGLNKAGTIRLYAHKDSGNGNILTVTILDGTIDAITLDVAQTATFEVKAGENVVNATEGTTYAIGATSFVIQNKTQGATTQLHLNKIDITYTSSTSTPEQPGDTTVTPEVKEFYNVAEAIAAYDKGELAKNDFVSVKGVVTKMDIKPANFVKYGSVNIYLADATGAAGEFELYNCYSLEKDTFATTDPTFDATSTSWLSLTAATDRNGKTVNVGDTVIGYGKITLYNTTYELNTGCYLTSVKSPAPAATVVAVENTTVSEMGQNLVLQGQWNEKAVTISLYPGVTKGFGVYSGEGEGDFWGTIGTADLFANGTDATYTDNGNGTFTFKATMKDATNALYEITMNGLIPVKHTYTVAGSPVAVFGTEWDPSNTANDMFLMYGTIYAWEKYNVTLSAGKIQFKVCEDHAWDTAYPASNYELDIPASGIYTIMIMFDAASGMVEAFAEKTGEAAVIPTIAIAGDMNGWSTSANTFTIAEDEKTASLALNLEAKDYGFKMIIAGSWTSDAQQITRENNVTTYTGANGENGTLTADVAGEYIFTWTYETNTLVVTYPAKEEPQPVATWDEIVFTELAAKGSLNGAVFAAANNAAFTLTVTDTDASKQEIDQNTASFGTAEENKAYDFRLKTGGKSSSKNGLTLAIPADGTLRIAARTGSNSATDRNLVVKQADVELYNKLVVEADKVGDYYPYIYVEVKQGNVVLEYPVNTINFYAFGFKAAEGPATGFEEIEAAEKAVKFIENGQIFILRDGAVFNLMGARVK